MQTPIPDYLTEVVDGARPEDDGELADYIPELAAADPDRLALAVATTDGTLYAVGDTEVEFSIQSISKPFIYALALADHGLDAVLAKVGVEPSGEAFNELSLENESGRPLNPMINAGAITAHSLVGQERALAGLAAFAGRELAVDETVFASELATADRNRAIGYMLRTHGIIDTEPPAVVEGYTRQCSVLVTVRDLAMMACTLSGGGVHPLTGERVVPAWVSRQVMSVMSTCGMYDAAGDWFTTVGIPAKSGVSGGIIGALPARGGIAAFSPRLDAHGNSVRGVRIFERLSNDMGMHLMEVQAPPRSMVRSTTPVAGASEQAVRFELQGAVDFAGMERLLRQLADHSDDDIGCLVLDLSRVTDVRDVGRRMLLEACRRLGLDGHTVVVVDPDNLLQTWDADEDDDRDLDVGDGPPARIVRSV